MGKWNVRKAMIQGLKCISGDIVYCSQCGYSSADGCGRGDRCKRECAKDILGFLKGQDDRIYYLEAILKDKAKALTLDQLIDLYNEKKTHVWPYNTPPVYVDANKYGMVKRWILDLLA